MPVRSLDSSVLKWPDAKRVVSAFRAWARELIEEEKAIVRVGYFGSYARGTSGVGSDLDVIVIIQDTEEPRERRGLKWDTSSIPVPVDLQVFTEREWNSMAVSGRFRRTVDLEAIWFPPRTR